MPLPCRSKQATNLAVDQIFNAAGNGHKAKMVLCNGSNDTCADLALLVRNTEANPQSTQTWIDNTGAATVLASAEVLALAPSTGNWMGATHAALAQVLAGLAASSATVTTIAETDVVFALPTTT